MKYLYVLTSDSSDSYLEQALLSVTSLRLQMPDAFISLIVDDITEKNLTNKRGEIIKLINEYKSIKIDKQINKMARSRWLKTSMRLNIDGDFLFIDNDTIITEDISSIDNINVEIGAVLDDHTYISEYEKYRPSRLREIKTIFKKNKFDSPFDFKTYFNSGVLLCRDCKTGHNFFREWHRLWLQCLELGHLIDQPSFNQANYNQGNIIRELGGIWNCQLMHDGAIIYLHDAKIIHYFATHVHEKSFLLANKELTETIKETGIIDQKTTDMLKNPKAQFSSNSRIMLIDNSLREFYDSAICGAAKRIYYTNTGAFIEFIFARIKKYIFTPIRKKIFNGKRPFIIFLHKKK